MNRAATTLTRAEFDRPKVEQFDLAIGALLWAFAGPAMHPPTMHAAHKTFICVFIFFPSWLANLNFLAP